MRLIWMESYDDDSRQSGIMTLEGGLVGGQLVCVTSPSPRACIPLEDPDVDKPVHVQAYYCSIIPMPREKYLFQIFVLTYYLYCSF